MGKKKKIWKLEEETERVHQSADLIDAILTGKDFDIDSAPDQPTKKPKKKSFKKKLNDQIAAIACGGNLTYDDELEEELDEEVEEPPRTFLDMMNSPYLKDRDVNVNHNCDTDEKDIEHQPVTFIENEKNDDDESDDMYDEEDEPDRDEGDLDRNEYMTIEASPLIINETSVTEGNNVGVFEINDGAISVPISFKYIDMITAHLLPEHILNTIGNSEDHSDNIEKHLDEFCDGLVLQYIALTRHPMVKFTEDEFPLYFSTWKKINIRNFMLIDTGNGEIYGVEIGNLANTLRGIAEVYASTRRETASDILPLYKFYIGVGSAMTFINNQCDYDDGDYLHQFMQEYECDLMNEKDFLTLIQEDEGTVHRNINELDENGLVDLDTLEDDLNVITRYTDFKVLAEQILSLLRVPAGTINDFEGEFADGLEDELEEVADLFNGELDENYEEKEPEVETGNIDPSKEYSSEEEMREDVSPENAEALEDAVESIFDDVPGAESVPDDGDDSMQVPVCND